MNKKTMKAYRIWRAMKARCYSPSQNKGHYKDRHIAVCERWRNSFDAFIADMGELPNDNYSIERLDVLKGYEPSNCKWILQREQPKNRSNTIWFYMGDEKMCLRDAARKLGVKYTTIYGRYRKGGRKAVDTAIREYYGMGGGE